MNRFMDRFFPQKEVVTEGAVPEPASNEEQIPLIQEKKTKTLEDISEAKDKVGVLETQKKELIEKHRENIEQLKNLGVNEKQKDSVNRSETFNDVLNPIENEIKNIAEEISNLREDNDLQQKPNEILRRRMERLNELCYINTKDFLSTETGEKFLEMIANNENENKTIPTELTLENALQYSDFIYNYVNGKNGRSILDRIDYDNFRNKNAKIKMLLGLTDSKLDDINTTR